MKKTLGLILLSFLAFSWASAAAPAQFKPADYTVHLIGHAHIDLGWLWRWEETLRDIMVQTFRGTLEMMNRVKGLTFAQSQVALYESLESDQPQIYEAVKAKIRQGTWVPVGGMWAEPDLNMPDGEALVRQLLYGQRYLRDRFGIQAKVGWNPDSFGHNAQLPQVLKKSMIDFYVLERCAPDKTPVFWWEAPDGSRILCYAPPGWYNVSLKNGVRDIIAEASQYTPLKDFMLLYGEGDHGGGPRKADIEGYQKYRRDRSSPRLDFGSPNDYFRMIAGLGVDFPLVKKELNFTFPACYTTQAQTKRNNRRAESLLLTAEKFSSLATLAGFRDYYPERDLDEAWKVTLRNQFHDILDGSGIGPLYDEIAASYREAFNRGRRALDFSLETIALAIDTRGEGWPVVVFNPLFWDRTDGVEAAVTLPADEAEAGLKIVDSQGKEIPCQILAKTPQEGKAVFRILFVAEAVPSFGYKVFRALPGSPTPEPHSPLSVSLTLLENEYFKVALNPETGGMASILDKRAGRQVLASEGNVLEAIADEPASMSAWELGLKGRVGRVGETGARLEVVERGPVRVTVRVSGAFRNSRFIQDISLYRGLPRIDCRLKFDWQERNVMLKAAFPASVKNREAFFEIPYGAVARPTDGTEVPALRWIDLTDESGQYGLSLLNDCKYGFDVKDHVLRLSVIHGATYPDPEADRGPHELLYSLYPHAGTWQEAGTVKRGYELNSPLEARAVMSHAGAWPAEASFIRAEGDGAIISALKKEYGYYSGGQILRVYETFGKTAQVRLAFPWPVRAEECNLLDDSLGKLELVQGKLVLNLKPYEIKTVKIFRLPSGGS